MSERILIADYDPRWPEQFAAEAAIIRAALGTVALRIEHVGSTAVPGLAAKPVIDVLLLVKDSSDEASYAPPLAAAGYELRIREPHWHEHRMFNRKGAEVNLHVFSTGCPEVERMIAFRDWLRRRPDDRALYQRAKLELSGKEWKTVQDYADAKTAIVQKIMARALADGK